MDCLQYMFQSPYHFFGCVFVLIVILTAIDYLVGQLFCLSEKVFGFSLVPCYKNKINKGPNNGL